MSTPREQTLALITHYYNVFNVGDRDGFLDLLTDDVQHDINQGKSEIGRDTFATFLERMDRCYREQVDELQVFSSEDGKRGSAEFYICGSYINTDESLPPATGQTYRLRVGAFFEIRDQKVSRVTNYYNLEEWLRLVGA